MVLNRLIAVGFLAAPLTAPLAGEIAGRVTDEQGLGLKGVRVCLSLAHEGPRDCVKARYTGKNGDYSFPGLDDSAPYVVRVLSGASLAARKADPYPQYAWAPATRTVALASRKDKVEDADFTGSFNFSNFQATVELGASDFPELASYDLVNDYVFLKVYAVDPSNSEQDLIFLGQVTELSRLLIEVSVTLSTTRLFYEVYSAANPNPVVASINLVDPV